MADIVHLMRYTVLEHPGLLDRPFMCTTDLRFVTCPKCIEIYNREFQKTKVREAEFQRWFAAANHPDESDA